MRTRKVLLNIFSTVFTQIVSIIISLLIPPLIIHQYGSTLNGLLSTISQFIIYFALLDGGVAVASAISLYKPLYENDKDKINSILSALRKYYTKVGIIFTLLIIILSFAMSFYFSDQLPIYITLLLVLILGVSNSYSFLITGKYNVLVNADGKSYVKNNILIIFKFLGVILQYFLIKKGYSIVLVQLALSLTIVLSIIPLKKYVSRKYPFINFYSVPDKSAFSDRNEAFIVQVSSIIKKGAPIIITTIVLGLKEASILNIYILLFHTGNSFLEMLSQSITANFGNVFASGNKNLIVKLYKISDFLIYVFVGLIAICFFSLTLPFIKIYIGLSADMNYIVPSLLILMVISEWFNGMTFTSKTMIIASGNLKKLSYPYLFDLVFTIVFGYLGIIIYGLPGVIIGSVIGNIVRFIMMYLTSNKIVLGGTKFSHLMILIVNVVVIILISYLTTYVIYIPHSFYSWILMAILIAIPCLLILIIVNILINYEGFKSFGIIARKLLNLKIK